MKQLIIISTFVFFSAVVSQAQQNALSSLFSFNKLAFNPAYTGAENNSSVYLLHRNQWAGLKGAPQTELLAYNMSGYTQNHAFGGILSRQSLGIQERLDLQASYSYLLRFNESRLRIGGQLNWRNYKSDFASDDLFAIDGFELDPSLERSVISSGQLNFGIGIFYKNRDFFAGAAASNLAPRGLKLGNPLLEVDESRHYYAIIGAGFDINNEWRYKPEILLKLTDNAPYNLDILSLFIFRENLSLGLNIRSGGSSNAFLESIDYVMGFQFTENVFAGLSYDISLSEISDVENGSIELMLKYIFLRKAENPENLIVPEGNGRHEELTGKAEETSILEDSIQNDVLVKINTYIIDKKALEPGQSITFARLDYDSDSLNLSRAEKVLMIKLREWLNSIPEMKLSLKVHTDSRGDDEKNKIFTNRRARLLSNYLLRDTNLSTRIIVYGMGESELANGCRDSKPCSEEKHAENRRIVIESGTQ